MFWALYHDITLICLSYVWICDSGTRMRCIRFSSEKQVWHIVPEILLHILLHLHISRAAASFRPFFCLCWPLLFWIMPSLSAADPMIGFLACPRRSQTESIKFCMIFVKQVSIILFGELLAHSQHKYNGYCSILSPKETKKREHM
jgi:hypothetical protein